MAKWVDYYKIINPQSKKEKYVATDYNSANNGYYNYSWYSNIIKSAAGRSSRYRQYESMDYDPDISKALDTIAEEMTGTDLNSGMCIDIEFNNDDTKEIESSIIVTLKAALRHWINLNELKSKLFFISRTTIKYGDCFFIKKSDFKKWVFVHPENVVGVELDEDNIPIRYHIRNASANKMIASDTENLSVYDADAIVHFSLSQEFDDDGPFGLSVLSPVVKPYKQLQLLEGSVIIYRIVRAPERRAFYIDTGNLIGHKQKAVLEATKNEIRQRRYANSTGGTNEIDSVYDPLSMVEDFFFATNGATGRGTKVEILQGGDNLGEITDLNFFQNKVFRGLKIPSSYLRGAEAQGAVFNDGKTGIAYIEEMAFANYVKRLQNSISQTLDKQFKLYLEASNIRIDKHLFNIKLPIAQNFTAYRKAQLMSDLFNSMSNVENLDYISKRYAMKLILNLSEDDIQINEELVKAERGIPDDGISGMTDIRLIYDKTLADKIPTGSPDEGGLGSDNMNMGMPTSDDMGISEPDNTSSESPIEEPPEEQPDITGQSINDLLGSSADQDNRQDNRQDEQPSSSDEEPSSDVFQDLNSPDDYGTTSPAIQNDISLDSLFDDGDDSKNNKSKKKLSLKDFL